ncbi:hypothetical protein M2323_002807 [Rhodoblastus acidophilus]|uniref:DUF2778 domain-containing protein n=1 Tax=Rhodoblastus acidophilus TaxID=1074 RepID=UPI0022252C90|nr:DUF2778 domain-containing protein [Rhodoblastus acidophilus]MCW2284839.1 hypothetical protein [Rhodoblastus acidophilus]MCW2333871.1 hypothetical protein [Rhodoblastus acidophilus]
MTDWSFEATALDAMEKASLPRKIFTRTVPVLAAMSFSALVALRVAGGLANQAIAPEPPHGATAAKPAPAADAPMQAAVVPQPTPRLAAAEIRPAVSPFGELFDPDYASGGNIVADGRPFALDRSLFQSDPMYTPEPEAQQQQQVAEAEAQPAPAPAAPLTEPQKGAADLGLRLAEEETVVPQPPSRPSDLAPARVAKVEDKATPAPAVTEPRMSPRVAARRLRAQPQMQAETDTRSFFDKLFGSSDKPREKGPQLAYASPDGGSALKMSSGLFSAARPTEGVAVYNISAHTVTLPSGKQLEAHSGLGPYFDNPNGVHLRMKGSTPPATYRLSLRETLFHGVQAIRLTPLDSSVHGRNGLLAHTFMLGPRGDSNGCVSFRNYRDFLEAYRNGEIRHLKVVSGG